MDIKGGKFYKFRAFNDPFDCEIGIDLHYIIDVMYGAELKS